MGNLIVSDGEYASIAQQYRAISKRAEAYISDYLNIMDSILKERSMQGVTADAIAAYTCKVKAIKGQLDEVVRVMQGQLEAFVREIDQKDRHLY